VPILVFLSISVLEFVVREQQLPTLYLCTKFEKRSFNRLQNIESVAKFRNWVTSPRPRPLGGFAICEQELPAVCQYATFEERRRYDTFSF